MEKYRTVGFKCFLLLNPRLLKEWLDTLGITLIGFLVEVKSDSTLMSVQQIRSYTGKGGGGSAGLALSKKGCNCRLFYSI